MSTISLETEPSPEHTPESRKALSRWLMEAANAELEAGYRIQAGEKAWNAIVQYYKLIAARRGWRHDSTRQLESLGRHLMAEFPDYAAAEVINGLADAYHRGHENFYENVLYDDEVLDVIEGVETALPVLEAISMTPPRPFRIESRSQLRRLKLLTGNEALQVGDVSPVGFSQVADSSASSE
jgi:hypothetical protein